jgi:hypothetical protein
MNDQPTEEEKAEFERMAQLFRAQKAPRVRQEENSAGLLPLRSLEAHALECLLNGRLEP